MEILPEYFRPVLEFQQIMAAHGAALDDLESRLRRLKDNCFVQTADSEALKVYEDLFGLVYRPGETLDYRRQRILQKFNTVAPFSYEFLKDRLTEIFGSEYELDVDSEKCVLKIIVTSSRYGAVDLLYSLVWDIVPMHLEVIANHQVTNNVPGNIYTAAVPAVTVVQTIGG